MLLALRANGQTGKGNSNAGHILVITGPSGQSIFDALRNIDEQDTLRVKKKRTEITVEVDEVIHAVGRRHQLTCAWCPACQSEVPMVTPQSIAISLGVPEREIFRLIEAGRIHFMETDRIFACLSCYRNSTSEMEIIENG